jgi:SpoVK/Ycf46/Vps4 family AAA+-type ATPase
VQLFVEAKRHRPSILYIPQIDHWCNPLSEVVISTFDSLLQSLNPYDPILLLATCECRPNQLPKTVRRWFKEGMYFVAVAQSPDEVSERMQTSRYHIHVHHYIL